MNAPTFQEYKSIGTERIIRQFQWNKRYQRACRAIGKCEKDGVVWYMWQWLSKGKPTGKSGIFHQAETTP